jgi:hypothetical protein
MRPRIKNKYRRINMDIVIVGIIVAGAVIFSVRSFVKIYKGEGDCSCGTGCSCSSKNLCNSDFPIANKKQ